MAFVCPEHTDKQDSLLKTGAKIVPLASTKAPVPQVPAVPVQQALQLLVRKAWH
jgi:hypothetical protein